MTYFRRGNYRCATVLTIHLHPKPLHSIQHYLSQLLTSMLNYTEYTSCDKALPANH